MHPSGKRRDGHHARATTALAVGAAIVLLAGGSAALAASDAVRAPSCTAQQGQQLIDAGQYKQAIREFTCVIGADPTAVAGYRGRIEAELMLGRFSDAVRDYVRVNAFVVPVHADAQQVIIAGYDARLAVCRRVTALTGKSFAYWWFFDYPAAIHVLDHLIDVRPNDVYGNLFRGSSRVLHGASRAAGRQTSSARSRSPRRAPMSGSSSPTRTPMASCRTRSVRSTRQRSRSMVGSTRRASMRSSPARTSPSGT